MTGALKTTMAIVLALMVSFTSYAEELNYNIYHLSADAEDEITNDTMEVTLVASHQAMQSSEANMVVNRQMASALKNLKQTKGIHYETGNYRTQPIYQKQQIVGWRASQQIELKSSDVERLSELVGKLQKELKVSSMSFDVSKQVRQKTENLLSVAALTKFKERAVLIQKTMAADSYQIVSIAVNTTQPRPIRRSMMREGMAMMASDSSAPSVESGNSTINVEVAGRIQLTFN